MTLSAATTLTLIVPRASEVWVEAFDHQGEEVAFVAKGWHARILQHEIDHLEGTLFTDRMLPQSFCSQQNYARYWRDRSRQELDAMLQPTR